MKQTLLTFFAAFTAFTAAAEEASVITLDLTKATTELTFSAETGAWTGTFDDDAESIESQCFVFAHNSMADYQTWWGFTASNSADNSRREDYITYQFSDMAKGGIELNDDGSVKLDSYGAPVVNASVPYMVAYYNAYMSRRPVDITFSDGKSYEPVGVYINLNSYAYYNLEEGNPFSREFTNNDNFTLTIHGIAPDESEKTIEVSLASYKNGCLTINRGWMYVDLTSLGTVNEIYFTMDSTDTGNYGMNTPGYFCLDKLQVKPAGQSSVANLTATGCNISYNRSSHIVSVEGAEFAAVYNTEGYLVMSSDQSSFSLASLPAGIYIVKAGDAKIKIAR